MSESTESKSYRPTLYLKRGCPYCCKVVCYLADAGMSKSAADWKWDTPENREMITEKCGKASFPTLQIGPDEFMQESEDIIDRFIAESNLARADAVSYTYFAGAHPAPEGDDKPVTMMGFIGKMFKYGMGKAGGYGQFMAALKEV